MPRKDIINPRMAQAIPIKKPWYNWLVSATRIVRLLLMNGLHCCLAVVPSKTTWITGAATVYMGFVPHGSFF